MIEGLIGIIVGFGLGYSTSYFIQKGKNKAMKEDISEITFKKESISSAMTLDVEKRKSHYESKKEQYIKYFNLLDEFTSDATLVGQKNIAPLISKFMADFVLCAGNKSRELNISSQFATAINAEVLKSNEKWIKMENETNAIRLIDNNQTVGLLNDLENSYNVFFEHSGLLFRSLPELIVSKQVEKLKEIQNELQILSDKIKSTKGQLTSSMRDDLNEI